MRAFDRVLDLAWTRTSYSGLTAGLHEQPSAGVTSEAETPGTVDEPEVPAAGTTPAAEEGMPSPMADLPKGAAFGTLVHALLENTDFTAPDLRGQLAAEAERAGVFHATGAVSYTHLTLPTICSV